MYDYIVTKTRKHSKRTSSLNRVIKRTKKVVPAVGKGLKTVGNTAKDVVAKSVPVVEKGASVVYGTLATGFDMGVNTLAKGLSKKKLSKRNRKHSGKSRRR